MTKLVGRPLVRLLLLLIVISIPFAPTLRNMYTNLVDWRDYAYIVWVMSQNVQDFLSLNFANLPHTNAFYPYLNTMYLSDLLIPQSIIMIPFYIISKNYIFAFNATLFTTVLLNAVAAYFFWKSVFKKEMAAFLGSFLSTYSPFFHVQLGHFQMISWWPFYISLYFLSKGSVKSYFIAGLFVGVQFLASAYLAVFLSFTITIYFLVKAYETGKLGQIKQLLYVFFAFFLIAGVFVKGYIDAKQYFEIERGYGEYVLYSAHLSDYMFSKSINSPLHNLNVISHWNRFSFHFGEHPSFPGFAISILAIIALFSIRSSKKISLSIILSKKEIFYLVLVVVGFIFSLGPRLQFNGGYDHIPMPYHFLLKYIPLIDSVRVPARWSFILYIGLTYFALKTISKIRSKVLLVAVILLVFFEYYPIQIPSVYDTYLKPKDAILAEVCREKPRVVLEIPVTHFDAKGGLISGLTYITKTQLASTSHGCSLVNGYSGYDLPSLQSIKDNIYASTLEQDSMIFYETIKETGAEYVVINQDNVLEESKSGMQTIVEDLEFEGKLESIGYGVFKLN